MLIKTKISAPLVRTDIVPRERLNTQLNRGLDHLLTLVCAGAGFGKTTLVSAWASELAFKESSTPPPLIAWLSLDKRDSDLNQFLHYFIAAIREVVPTACEQTLGLLQNESEPPLTLLLPVLGNDFLLLPNPTVVVLDDYHTIQGTAVHDLLNELLTHWPLPLHLVLLTRFTPPLPIARLRARGDIVEIRNHDLRFIPNEIAEYVDRMWQVSLSPTSLDLLRQKTEGWIASLQLAGLSLRVSGNIEAALNSLSGSNVDIAEYLVDEVLSQQPYAVQIFLFKLSILDRFTLPLCEAIVANEDPKWPVQTMLEWLLHSNLFVIPLDNHQEWYRFHHLFRDLLRQRLKTRLSQEEIANLHQDAANWLAQEGLLDTAILHALEAQDLNLAADFMEQNLCNMLNREDGKTLNRWLQLLPEAFVDSRPGLLIIKAWLLSSTWHLNSVCQVIQKIETALYQPDAATLSPEYRQTLRGQMAVLKSQVAFHTGEPALSVTYGQEALASLPATWQYARGGVMSYLALSMQAVGDETAAEAMLLELYEPLLDKTSNFALRLIFTLSLVSIQGGKLEQAVQTAKLLLQQAIQVESLLLQGWANLILGLVYYEWNQLDLAAQHFEEIVARGYRMNSLVLRQGYAGAILIHLVAGRLAEATQLVEFISQYDTELNGRLDDLTQSLRAKIWLASGNSEETYQWAKTFTPPITPVLFILLSLPQLTKVRILLDRGSQADTTLARHILEELTAVAEQNHNIRRKIEIFGATALALDAQGENTAAKAALKQAIELARPGGFIRIFVNLGPRMQVMLASLIMSTAYTEYIHRILEAFPHKLAAPHPTSTNNKTLLPAPPSLTPSVSTPPLVESLTSRELQILVLLREPLSAREIALKLNISYATAKRHSINIYGKLGVNSRWASVARAEALGILAPR